MNRKGFTLIELLIVVVIIGILAAIAIPKFANTKEKAYIASEKSDLRNLVTAEEAYFADHTTYTTTIGGANGVSYNQSAAVTVTISAAGGSGWNAGSVHSGTTTTCSIWAGDSTTYALSGPAGQLSEGAPTCW
jgi:prepilin-type N-terminal cleavage/methylation domain-containing protein